MTAERKKILYVEDDENLRASLTASLKRNFKDADIEAVASVDEALKILSKRCREFSLILTDNSTNSKHNGIDLAREFASRVPVVICSGERNAAQHARQVGAGFIDKTRGLSLHGLKAYVPALEKAINGGVVVMPEVIQDIANVGTPS